MKLFLLRLITFPCFSAIAKISFGTVLLMPWQIFSNGRSWESMALFFNNFGWALTYAQAEIVWGILVLVAGILHLISLFIGPKSVIVASYLSVWLWIFISTMFFISNPYTTGPYTYGLIALFDLMRVMLKKGQLILLK